MLCCRPHRCWEEDCGQRQRLPIWQCSEWSLRPDSRPEVRLLSFLTNFALSSRLSLPRRLSLQLGWLDIVREVAIDETSHKDFWRHVLSNFQQNLCTSWWQNISTQQGGKREQDSSHLNWDSKLIDSGGLQQVQTKLQFHYISWALSFLGSYVQGERHMSTRSSCMLPFRSTRMICF